MTLDLFRIIECLGYYHSKSVNDITMCVRFKLTILRSEKVIGLVPAILSCMLIVR